MYAAAADELGMPTRRAVREPPARTRGARRAQPSTAVRSSARATLPRAARPPRCSRGRRARRRGDRLERRINARHLAAPARRRSTCRWSSCRTSSPRSSVPTRSSWPLATSLDGAAAAPAPGARRMKSRGRSSTDVVWRATASSICAGSGGVGKTTTAAPIAVRGALAGRRTVVHDDRPGARLADALGLAAARQRGSARGRGRRGAARVPLSAMMLDQKGAWDALVERYAPIDGGRASASSQNRFYQHLSQSFAGSQEYMAIEQLCELHASGRYDLIVVDTPPTRHALDFLEAPQAHRRLSRPDRSSSGSSGRTSPPAGRRCASINRTVGFLLHRLEDATGVTALVEISDFFSSMSGLFEDFEPRVQRVDAAAARRRRPRSCWSPRPEEQVLDEAEYFCGRVARLGMPLRAVVFNRVHARTGEARAMPATRTRSVRWSLACSGPRRRTALVENFVRLPGARARRSACAWRPFGARCRAARPSPKCPTFIPTSTAWTTYGPCTSSCSRRKPGPPSGSGAFPSPDECGRVLHGARVKGVFDAIGIATE